MTSNHDCPTTAHLTDAERMFISAHLSPADEAIAIVERVVCERGKAAPTSIGTARVEVDIDWDALLEQSDSRMRAAVFDAGWDACRKFYDLAPE